MRVPNQCPPAHVRPGKAEFVRTALLGLLPSRRTRRGASAGATVAVLVFTGSLGAYLKTSLGLVAAARALAVIRNRNYVLPQDIFDIAPEVMRHRLVLSYEALARDITADHVVAGILATVPAPRVAPSQEPTYGSSAAG